MATHSSILAWRISQTIGTWRAIVHGVKESDMTERLTTVSLSHNMLALKNDLGDHFVLSLHIIAEKTETH